MLLGSAGRKAVDRKARLAGNGVSLTRDQRSMQLAGRFHQTVTNPAGKWWLLAGLCQALSAATQSVIPDQTHLAVQAHNDLSMCTGIGNCATHFEFAFFQLVSAG